MNSHPIQYFAPLYRRLAQEPGIELSIYFCSLQGADTYRDTEFGVDLKWDVPLLDGYRSILLPNFRRGNSVAGFFSLINPAIVWELRRGRYDALWVHGHGYLTYVLAIIAAKFLGIPVLMRCETHLQLQRSPLKRVLRGKLMRVLYTRLCAGCLPIGTRNRQFYRFHGVDDDHLFLVPYVVDNAFFAGSAAHFRNRRAELFDQFGIPTDKPAILFASKLMSRKRPADLLRAFERLRGDGVEASLLFVGSGELEAELREYVSQRSIPDVHFFGFRNQSELPQLYALADIFVLPSENEPWGLIINEVMAAGLPVVATSEIGAVADLVIHGDNGFVYTTGDVPALTTHLSSLVQDEDLRRTMGRRSEQRIASWDFERCVAGVRAALSFVGDGRGSSTTPLAREPNAADNVTGAPWPPTA